MRPLALHQITAFEADPVELVTIARQTGCQAVCVFTHVPSVLRDQRKSGMPVMPMVTVHNKIRFQARLADEGISVGNVEFFSILPDIDINEYRAGLALGAEIGARRAVTHIYEPNEAVAIDKLGKLCDLAAEYSLDIGLEFLGLSPPCDNVRKAAWFIDQIGRSNIGIGVDALHFVRGGSSIDDVKAVPARYFNYAQICDGRGLHHEVDYMPEAMSRMIPGEGEFPLRDLISALPLATALDVEVPRAVRDTPVLDYVQKAVDATRALMAAAHVTR